MPLANKNSVYIFGLILLAGLRCAQFDSEGSAIGFLLVGENGASAGSSGSASIGTDGTTEITDTLVNTVQTGTVTMTTATQTVTVTSVDTTKAFVLCHFRAGSSESSNAPTCQLSSATQITVQIGAANANVVVYWQLIEFSSGAVVQRGAQSLPNGTASANITLSSVDTTKSFALVYTRTASTTNDADQRRLVIGKITGATNLTIERASTGEAVDVEWQVVELNDASVQSGQTAIPNGTVAQAVAVSAVDTSSSFLIMNYDADDVVLGRDKAYALLGEIASSTQINFFRYTGTGDLTANWFLVELPNATTQSGFVDTNPLPHTETQLNATLTAVDTSKSMAIAYSSMDGGLAQAALESLYFAPSFNSSTDLLLERGIDNATIASARWYVVELP